MDEHRMKITRGTITGLLKAMLRHASADTSRPHLSGVSFQGCGKELYIAASDGHRVIEARIGKSCIWPETLVPVSSVKAAIAHLRPRKKAEHQEMCTVRHDGLGLHVHAPGVSSEEITLQNNSKHHFPSMHRIVPQLRDGPCQAPGVWGVNPLYLRDAMESIRDVFHGLPALPHARLTTPCVGELSPLRIDAEGYREHLGISLTMTIMPVRL